MGMLPLILLLHLLVLPPLLVLLSLIVLNRMVSGPFWLALKALLRTSGIPFDPSQFTKENWLSPHNQLLSIWTQNALREEICLKIRIPAVPNPRLDLIRGTPDILLQQPITRNQKEEKRRKDGDQHF
jgi:hypothetical protein